MAWGVRFDSSVDSILGHTWLVELLEEDYVGATTTLPGGGPKDGYIIDWGEEDRDIDEPILASVATVKLVDKSSALFDWLTDTDEGKARMRISRNGSVFWHGIITPDIDERSDDYLIDGSLAASAVDGLAHLKGQRFIDFTVDPAPFLGEKTIIEAIANCLSKLPYQLNFRIASNWYDVAMANAEPLNQLGFLWFALFDQNKQKSFDCLEALRQILLAIGAQIHQEEEIWWITQREMLYTAGTITWTEYDTTGALVGTHTFDPDVALPAGFTKHSARYKGARIKYLQPYRSASVIYDHGEPKSLIRNGSFEETDLDDADAIPYWTPPAGDTYSDIIALPAQFSFNFAYLPYVASSDPDVTDVVKWLTSKDELPASAGIAYRIKFDVRVAAGVDGGGEPIASSDSRAFVWAKVKFGAKWLKRTGATGDTFEWSDSEVAILLGGGNGLPGDEWVTEEWDTPDVVADSYPEIALSQVVSPEFSGNAYFPTVYYDNISIKPLSADGLAVSTETVATDPDSTALEEREPVTLRLGDGPPGGAFGTLKVYSGGSWIPTSDWSRGYGGASLGSHAELVSLSRMEAQRKRVIAIRAKWNKAFTVRPKRRLYLDGERYSVNRLRLDCYTESAEGEFIRIQQDSFTPEYKEYKDRVDPPPGKGGGGLEETFSVGIQYSWEFDESDLLWDLVVTWTPQGRTKSVRYALETSDAEPGDWSVESIGAKDADQESGTFTIPDLPHGAQYYLFVKAYSGTNGDGGEDGKTVRVPLTPPTNPETFFGGFTNPTYCLYRYGESPHWMLTPYIQSSGGETVVKNVNSNSSDGAIVDAASHVSWDDVLGLVTDDGANGYVQWQNDVLGQLGLVRWVAFGIDNRQSASAQTIFDFDAGTAGNYKLTIQTDGTLRFAVTDNAASGTENVDSDLVIPVGESVRWGVGIELQATSPSPADIVLYVMTAGLAWKRYTGSQSNDCSLDWTDLKTLAAGTDAARFLYQIGDVPLPSTQEFVSMAICMGNFASSKGSTTTDTTSPDAFGVLDDTNFTAYDLQGNILGQVAHGLTPTHYGRPCYDPITKRFVICGFDGKVYSWAIGEGSLTEEYDFTGTKKVRAIVYDHTSQRVLAGCSDASGSGDFGHFTDRDTSYSWNSISTSYQIVDFTTYLGAKRVWAIKTNDDLAEFSLISDTLTQLETRTPSNTPVAIYFRHGQGLYWEEDDGSLKYLEPLVETPYGGGLTSADIITIETSAFTYSQPGFVVRRDGLDGLRFTTVSAADHVVKFDYDLEDQATYKADVVALDDTPRGLCYYHAGIAPPDAPSGLSASAASSSQIDLTWTDNSDNESGFRVRWSDDGGSTWNYASVAADEESYSITGLDAETEYCVQVQSYNSGGSSAWVPSTPTCATTDAAPTEQLWILYRRYDSDGPNGYVGAVKDDGTSPWEVETDYYHTGNANTFDRIAKPDYDPVNDHVMFPDSDGSSTHDQFKALDFGGDGSDEAVVYSKSGATVWMTCVRQLDGGNVMVGRLGLFFETTDPTDFTVDRTVILSTAVGSPTLAGDDGLISDIRGSDGAMAFLNNTDEDLYKSPYASPGKALVKTSGSNTNRNGLHYGETYLHWQQFGAWYVIDPSDDSVVDSIILDYGNSPMDIWVDETNEYVYWVRYNDSGDGSCSIMRRPFTLSGGLSFTGSAETLLTKSRDGANGGIVGIRGISRSV